MDRRSFIKAGAVAVGLSAVGGGVWLQARRRSEARVSSVITAPWDVLGGGLWLLPDLHDAPMVVPDRPHSKQESMDPAQRAKVRRTRSFTVTTGAARLRSGDPGPKAEGTLRILTIGDSVTFGWGVPVDEAWPAALGARIATRRPVEVINAGVPGQRLATMAQWVEVKGRTLAPDVLVLVRRPELEGGGSGYRDVVQRMRRVLPNTSVFVALSPVSRFDLHGQEVAAREEAELKQLLGDTPVLDLTAGLRAAQGERGWGLRKVGGEIEAANLETGETGLRIRQWTPDTAAQLYAWLDTRPDVKETLFFDDGHPDGPGLAVVAELLDGWLTRYGVV